MHVFFLVSIKRLITPLLTDHLKIISVMKSELQSTSYKRTIPVSEITEKGPQRNGSLFKDIKSDLPASIVVFFVALPLCLGIALASGAPLFSGIIAGIVGGIVVGAASGSR